MIIQYYSIISPTGSGSLNNSENSSRRDSIAEEKERLAITESIEMSPPNKTNPYITPPSVTNGMIATIFSENITVNFSNLICHWIVDYILQK
jgi:hypothetical protein